MSGDDTGQPAWPRSMESYSIEKQIGRGAFSQVYRATAQLPHGETQTVAIKIVDKNEMRANGLLKRIISEVKIHSQCEHRSILHLYQFFEDSRYVYMVLEHCGMGELQQRLTQRSRFTETEMKAWLRDLVDATLYLHTHGVVHRDLKLANILLTDDHRVKLCDFGLAVKLSDRDEQRDTICGTPNYISPEIVQRRPHGLNADIWSLGVILYTCLVGFPPFESVEVKQTLARVARMDFHIPEFLSTEAKDLISRMLQEEPGDRLSLEGILHHSFLTGVARPQPLRKQVSSVKSSDSFSAKSDNSADSISRQLMAAPDDLSERSSSMELRALNASRLEPISYSTPKGLFSIMENRTARYQHYSGEFLMTVATDGVQIRMSDGRTYLLNDLPRQYRKYYILLRKFVDILRSRTPKIILEDTCGECVMMENTPSVDFEVRFNDGWKACLRNAESNRVLLEKKSKEAGVRRERVGVSYADLMCRNGVVEYSAEGDRLSQEVMEKCKLVHDMMKECMDIEHDHKDSRTWPRVFSFRNSKQCDRRRSDAEAGDVLAGLASMSLRDRDNNMTPPLVESTTSSTTSANTSSYNRSSRFIASDHSAFSARQLYDTHQHSNRSFDSSPSLSQPQPHARSRPRRPKTRITSRVTGQPTSRRATHSSSHTRSSNDSLTSIPEVSSSSFVRTRPAFHHHRDLNNSTSVSEPGAQSTSPLDSHPQRPAPHSYRRPHDDRDTATYPTSSRPRRSSATPSESSSQSCRIDGIGWAFRSAGGNISCHFDDGQQVILPSNNGSMIHIDEGGHTTHFDPSSGVSSSLQDKLEHVEVFIEKLLVAQMSDTHSQSSHSRPVSPSPAIVHQDECNSSFVSVRSHTLDDRSFVSTHSNTNNRDRDQFTFYSESHLDLMQPEQRSRHHHRRR